VRSDTSKADVERCIQQFLDGTGATWDWDDFICVPLRDPVLEFVRVQCAAVQTQFRPSDSTRYCSDDGLLELGRILEALRARRD
jgi:hypothetical protein